MLPQFLIDSAGVSAWFEAVCTSPVLFHALHWAVAVHCDLCGEETFWTVTRGALEHKTAAIQLIRQNLADIASLSHWDTEMLMLSIITLARTEIRREHVPESIVVSPFIPHLPTEYWQNLYGRMEAVQGHIRAVRVLVTRLGGLGKLSFPGHAYNLAL